MQGRRKKKKRHSNTDTALKGSIQNLEGLRRTKEGTSDVLIILGSMAIKYNIINRLWEYSSCLREHR